MTKTVLYFSNVHISNRLPCVGIWSCTAHKPKKVWPQDCGSLNWELGSLSEPSHTFPVYVQTLASAGQVNPSMESTLRQDGHNVTSGCCSPWWHLLTEIPLPDYLSVASTCAVRYGGNTVFSYINALCLFPCFTGILAFSSITFSSEITEKTRPLLDSVTFSAAGPHLDVSLQPFHPL